MPVFNFGNGEVPASVHKNPTGDLGGWVADTATVEQGVYISCSSTVFGSANVSSKASITGSSKIFGSANVSGNARVGYSSSVSGNSRVIQNASVADSIMTERALAGGTCVIEHSSLTDNVEVSGEAHIKDSQLSGFLLVGGLTQIKKCTARGLSNWAKLNDNGKFMGTIDKFVPLYLSGLGSWNISITDDIMKIGCQTLKIKEWWELSDESIQSMSGSEKDSLEWWNKYKKVIKTIINERTDFS